MREGTTFLAILLTALVFGMFFMPVNAWEYWNTMASSPQTDNLVDYSGPHADKIQINMYSSELAEFTALEQDQIDVTDWPVDAAHYGPWTDPLNPLSQKIAAVNSGPAFNMFTLDMRMDPRQFLDPLTNQIPNPAYTTSKGNPMSGVWLRRAIASAIDRKYTIQQIVSGGSLPLLGEAMFTPLSTAYGPWQHPQINPTGALAAYTYVKPDGSADIAKGNQFLDDHNYTLSSGRRTKNGEHFALQFYYRSDHAERRRFATEVMQPLLTTAPPNGLGIDLAMIPVTSSGASAEVMASKKGHLYTGEQTIETTDPDILYYSLHVDNYAHPGRPPNYMYYPGDANAYQMSSNEIYDGRRYGNGMIPYGAPALDFSDSAKIWPAGAIVWENPQNYWLTEMMSAQDTPRAQLAAYKAQEFIAYSVCGAPIWASASYTAFHRTYTGNTPGESAWTGQPWKGVVNQKGLGVCSKMSFYDMHPANALFGDGSHMTIRWGLRQPTMSLNPIYAEWAWDWYVLNQAYDSLIRLHPYTLENEPWLARNWELGTWYSPEDPFPYSKITFYLRHDVYWSDGLPMTASDIKFTWGGPLVTGSISNLLKARHMPPAYWAGQVADILSIATPDPWTVVVYLDAYAYFGLHSVSGLNIVLPEHIWKPIIETGDPTQPWNQPRVCSGGWVLDSTDDPSNHGNVMTLSKNPLHFNVNTATRDKPIDIWTMQTSNATGLIGNTHWICPRLDQTGVNVSVGVYLYDKYFFELGPSKGDIYPYTILDGTATVELWAWNGEGCPNQEENWVLYRALAPVHSFSAPYCITEFEEIDIPNLPPWWYYIRISITINSLEYSPDGGYTWIVANPANNPYDDMTYIYKEKMIITNRYDICGTYWSPPQANPSYQPVSDLAVEVGDIYACAMAYGSSIGCARWNPACDVFGDDYVVDVSDFYKIAQNYGWAASNPLSPKGT